MSDAIREAIQNVRSAIAHNTGYEPSISLLQRSLDELESALQSGEPVVDVTGMDEKDAMFTQIEAKARATFKRHVLSAKGQVHNRENIYNSHLVWAAIDWARANTTPQPVVDADDSFRSAFKEGFRYCAVHWADRSDLFSDVHSQKFCNDMEKILKAKALLSAGKGGE